MSETRGVALPILRNTMSEEPASECLNAELLKRETHKWERVRSTAQFVLGSTIWSTCLRNRR